MRFLKKIIRTIWLALILAACSLSVDVGDPPFTPAPTIEPSQTPTEEAAPTDPTEISATEEPPDSVPETVNPDLPWAGRNISGSLLLLVVQGGPVEFTELDLLTGEQRVLYSFPTGSQVTAAQASPDGTEIILAYAPPPVEGAAPISYLGLYLMPADGSEDPRLFLDGGGAPESLFFPTWSSDGKTVYYSRYVTTETGNKIDIERVSYPEAGEPEVLIENGFWQKISPDNTRMVYISWDIENQPEINTLYIADADGSNPAPLLDVDEFPVVDAPEFSADGTQILFSVPEPAPMENLSLLDRLMGVRSARAHDVPSDFWVASASGGDPQRLTNLYTMALYGDYNQDGSHIASIFILGSSHQTV